jgi:hypothetical protein
MLKLVRDAPNPGVEPTKPKLTSVSGIDGVLYAAESFSQDERYPGVTQQMVGFIKPLLDEVEGDPAAVDRVMTLGMLFWYLAMLPGDQQQQATRDLEPMVTTSKEGRASFRRMATMMIARHRAMFPLLHRGRR